MIPVDVSILDGKVKPSGPNLFLIIQDEGNNDRFTTDELIYTAITRARHNLFIINLGQDTYDSFFKNSIDNSFCLNHSNESVA